MAAFALLLMAACGDRSSALQYDLRVGFLPVLDELPYLVMHDRGFANDQHIRIKEIQYSGGAAALEDLAAGSLDVALVGTVPILSAAERGLIPDKAVLVAANDFADADHPAIAALVAPNITSWKDLDGKHIAVNALNSLNTAAIKGRLKQEGVRDFNLVEMPFANMGLALAGGNVAAATLTEPYLTQSLLRKDGKLLDWIIGGPPFESMEYTALAFRADFYSSNPKAVKAFLRAHLKAVRWVDQHTEEARSVLAKRLDLDQEVSQRLKLMKWSLDGRHDPSSLQRIQTVLIGVGMLKGTVAVDRLYHDTLLNEVLAE